MYICYASYDWKYGWFKSEIVTKIDEKFNDFKIMTITELREQITQGVSESLEKEIEKKEELKFTVYMVQGHVQNYQTQVNEFKDNQDELEQCDRRLYIRVDGVKIVENRTSNDVLQNVKSIIEKSSSEISDVAIDRSHQVGKAYTNKAFGLKCKSIIAGLRPFGIELCFTAIGRIWKVMWR